MAGLINTGVSALHAFQTQLRTTGHNIANVNTEGYSRQGVQLETLDANGRPSGYVGSGVEIGSITRSYDSYLTQRMRTYISSSAEYEVYHNRASQLDDVVADDAAGVDQIMQDFFNAVQDLADDPTSIPVRQVLMNRADLVADRFQSLDDWMINLRNQANEDMENYVDDINGLSESIASINTRIAELTSNASNPPNDLLDERDYLIDQLAEYTNVSTVDVDDGTTSVFIGTGQALVVGNSYNTLSVTSNSQATDYKEINLVTTSGSLVNISSQITGGRLGGIVKFRDEVLDSTQNALGRVAIAFADTFNNEHNTGIDLDGDFGADLFDVAAPQVLDDGTNSGSVTVTFDDLANVTTDEYKLAYDGATWTLTNLSTNTAETMTGSGTALDPYVADGLSIVIGAGAASGDLYRIRPTRLGASTIENLLTDPRDIAAAEALIAEDVATNTGTGHIDEGAQVTSTGTTALATPITLTYVSASNEFTVSSGGTLSYTPSTDSGNTLTLAVTGIGNFSFKMTGTPANGDTFTITDNSSGGVGDNRNALRLSDIQNTNVLVGSTATIGDAYGYMISNVGTRTAQAEDNYQVQSKLKTQAENAKDTVSGVNLDEEAADLLKFQHAYQAAAQVISASNSIFETLMGVVRR